MRKHIIWTNEDLDYEGDWKLSLEDEYLGRLDRAETDAIRAAADCAIGGDIPEEMEAP